jgi:hypothetical protein
MQLYANVFVFVAANSNRHSSNGCSPIFLATDTGKHTHTLPILTTRAVARQICAMGEAKICASPEFFFDKIELKLKKC